MALLAITVIALVFVAYLALQPTFVRRRRRKIARQAFPAEWRAILKRRVPYLRTLPVDLQLQLKKHIQIFLSEKTFVGCAGLAITDEIRVAIAAQACLLLLNRHTGYYPDLRQILVYPGAFVARKSTIDDAGIRHDYHRTLAGESWSNGQVIISWQDALEGAAIIDDGQNVVLHEFAHQLDQETGAANGAPGLRKHQSYQRWSSVLGEEFARLQEQSRLGLGSLLSHYGASNPAEFFAVATEVFFEQPTQLALESPALYEQLGALYRVNPLSWQ